MTATTTPLPNTRSSLVRDPSLYYTIKAATKIPAGTLVMRVQANNYVEPYVGNTVGAILMGWAEKTYDNTAGVAAYTYPNGQPMVFNRGVVDTLKSDGTITAADHVMTLVGLKDNQTIGATVAAHDCTALLVAIDLREGGVTAYQVDINQSGPTT